MIVADLDWFEHVLIFRHIYNMGGKLSTQRERFLRCLPIDNVLIYHCSDRDFFSPNYIKFAKECDGNSRFLKYAQNLGWFFLKKLDFFKIVKGGKFALIRMSIERYYLFKRTFFHKICGFFCRNQKNFNFGKIVKICCSTFLKKKRFRPSEKYLLQNQRAQNMPVVAGRLVIIFCHIYNHVFLYVYMPIALFWQSARSPISIFLQQITVECAWNNDISSKGQKKQNVFFWKKNSIIYEKYSRNEK